MKILRITLLTLFAVLLVASSVSAQELPPCVPPPCAQGQVCPMYACPIRPPGGVVTDPESLRIDFHRVTVKIENQIAHTTIDMKFENDGNTQAEGTWIFPVPLGASVDSLTMYINDQPIKAQVLDANDAQAQYDAIVRQYRDPVLLKYVGTQAIQANIFPIPPGESRRITLTYTQALEVDNGLIHYVYPFNVTKLYGARPVEDASISVDVTSNDPVSNIYSPSHSIVINRSDDTHFNVGWEQSDYIPDQDFSLYYGIASNTINVNMLTYRDSANADGFFMMMVQPPLQPPQDTVIARDIIVVLDQSGSMQGDKWNQAQQAADYVLQHLNSGDRFNAILFSTGWRLYANSLQPSSDASDAVNWIDGQDADGGTDINGALATALNMTDKERPTTILFLTDGLPTEGETDAQTILKNVDSEAGSNVSLFSFGVGDDVNTTLLDSLARDHHGASSYVRPNERIDEVVASLYSKIGSPVLTNVKLSVSGDAVLDTMYPSTPLPDLFAGNQLTIVGRYHGSANNISVTLSGDVSGKDQSFTYSNLGLRQNAGGDPFVARLWATRRIGDLLNTIRLDGESPELVQSVVDLSVRYGIITPYTSFLISDQDILSQSGRQAAQDNFSQTAQQLQSQVSGAGAVDAASAAGILQAANAPAPMLMAIPTSTAGGMGGAAPQVANGTVMQTQEDQQAQQNPIQTVGDKTFLFQNNTWTDTTFTPDTMTTQKVVFLSDDYFKLLADKPELAQYFAIGDHVIVVLDGTAYEVTAQ